MHNQTNLQSIKSKMGMSDDKPKKDSKKKIPTTYGKYSGIVDDDGKTVDNPTVKQAMSTMLKYMKNNTPESNVYRPEYIHTSVLYNRKKPGTTG